MNIQEAPFAMIRVLQTSEADAYRTVAERLGATVSTLAEPNKPFHKDLDGRVSTVPTSIFECGKATPLSATETAVCVFLRPSTMHAFFDDVKLNLATPKKPA